MPIGPWNFNKYSDMFKHKKVLDLACFQGDSTKTILDFGAESVTGLDVRSSHIDVAKKNNNDIKISYFVQDITNYSFVKPLVLQSDVISCFGVLYHLFDHFRFFQNIMTHNIEYILFETLYGPESKNPEMFWSYESTDPNTHGWLEGYSTTPYGTPNLSWIKQSAQIFNFDIDIVERYYFSDDFSNISDHERNKRMVVRLFNKKKFPTRTSLTLDEIWQWDNTNLINLSTNL